MIRKILLALHMKIFTFVNPTWTNSDVNLWKIDGVKMWHCKSIQFVFKKKADEVQIPFFLYTSKCYFTKIDSFYFFIFLRQFSYYRKRLTSTRTVAFNKCTSDVVDCG